MPSNVPSRKPAREAFAALLDAAFGTDWDVFNFKTNKFGDKAKNIVVAGAGSSRTETGADEEGGDPDSVFRLRVFVFVLYLSNAEAWTPHNSDDELDAAEKIITDVCRANRKNALWDKLEMMGESDPDMIVDEGGQTFRREIFNIRMENYS
jgi:hypothetical protein